MAGMASTERKQISTSASVFLLRYISTPVMTLIRTRTMTSTRATPTMSVRTSTSHTSTSTLMRTVSSFPPMMIVLLTPPTFREGVSASQLPPDLQLMIPAQFLVFYLCLLVLPGLPSTLALKCIHFQSTQAESYRVQRPRS